MIIGTSNRKNAFILLEVILAMGIFAMACTGLTVALNRMGQAAAVTKSELRITRILDSALTEQLTFPTLEEGEFQISVEDTDIELDIEIKPIEDLVNKDGETLQQMFHIIITAKWYENGQWYDRSVETWRYNPMYQP